MRMVNEQETMHWTDDGVQVSLFFVHMVYLQLLILIMSCSAKSFSHILTCPDVQ